MSCEAARNSRAILPSDREALVAKQSSEILRKVAKKNVDLRIVLPDNGKQEMKIPSAVVQLLGEIFEQISFGASVRVVPLKKEFSTQDAADYLNVSRPYVTKLCDSGKIPFHKVGNHRRILFQNLKLYKAEMMAESEKALVKLAKLSQKLGY